jgi:hypothetical protein
LVDVQQITPLPEAAEYQVQVREKARKEREARSGGADFTWFDVQIDGERHPMMWKRNANYLICKRLCDKGTNPDELAALFHWRPGRVWCVVDGRVDSTEFERLASEMSSSAGTSFDRRRWFCGEDELIQANGKTYAFSNQRGGQNWHRAMELLKEKYKQLEIDFSAVS